MTDTALTSSASDVVLENEDVHDGPSRFWIFALWALGLAFAWASLGPVFAALFIGSLGLKEILRQRFGARYGKLPIHLPYVVPLPYLFGVVCTVHGVAPTQPLSRRALFDISSFALGVHILLGVILLAVGILMAPTQAATEGYQLHFQPSLLESMLLALKGANLSELALGPVAHAGRALLITAVWSMIPIGQTDGGYIAYALLGSASRYLALALGVLVAVLAWKAHPMWWVVLAALLLALGKHPKLEAMRLPIRSRVGVLLALGLACVLCFSPNPIDYHLKLF